MRKILSLLFTIALITFSGSMAIGCTSDQIDVLGDGTQCETAKFSLTTTNLSANTQFKFYMSASGTFYIDCGADGSLYGTGVSGKTVTRSNTTEALYTCSYSSNGTKTIRFGGVATGYNTGTYANNTYYPTICFGNQYKHTSGTPTLLESVSGSLGALFPQLGSATNQIPHFGYTFYNCTNLQSISANLFSGITGGRRRMFQITFEYCTNLREIPDGLFKDVTTVAPEMFSNVFLGCSSLTSIPADLFLNVTDSAEWLFSSAFAGCSSLTEIPETLFFPKATSVTGQSSMFYDTFNGCTGLTSVPENLFSKITSSATNMFYQTFKGCENIEGYIPPSTFDGLINAGHPTATGMWSDTFNNTQLTGSCSNYPGTKQYITGYEGTTAGTTWNGKVSCEIDLTVAGIITYIMDGGTNYSGAPNLYLYGTGATISGTPTRDGYTFGGWCTDIGLTNCAMTQTISTIDTGNKTFYAKWNANASYTVTYSCGTGATGNPPASETVVENESFTPADNDTCAKTGYTFSGWNDGTTDRPVGTAYTYAYDDDVTLTATWTANTYDITLNNISEVPSGYTQLEYLQSSGTQWIDTGYTPNQDTNFRVKVNMTEATGYVVVGYYVSASEMFRIFNYNQSIYFDIDNRPSSGYTRINGGSFTNNVTYDFFVGNRYVKNYETGSILLGSEVANPSTWTGTQTIKVFPNSAKGKIYLLQIWENDSLLHNYVPARRDSDGVLGMYDTVTGTFKTNAGTGTFSAGNDVFVLGSTTSTYTYGVGDTIDANDAGTRTGYTFAGWCTDSGLTNCAMTQTIGTTATGDKTFYAKWTNAVATINCPAGQYLPMNANACATCTANSYCAGGEYEPSDSVDSGIVSCASGLYSPMGMWDATQCGRELHIGENIVYLHSVKKTSPSLHVMIGNNIYYGNMTTLDVPMSRGTERKLKIQYANTTYSVYDDSVVLPEP